MSSSSRFERIQAGEIAPGDRVARARTHEFRTVQAVQPGQTAVRLIYTSGGNDRPRKSAQWWREVDTLQTRADNVIAEEWSAIDIDAAVKVAGSPLERVCREARERDSHIVAHPDEFTRDEVQRAQLSIYQRERLQVRDVLRYS